jgi:hypothetical protein
LLAIGIGAGHLLASALEALLVAGQPLGFTFWLVRENTNSTITSTGGQNGDQLRPDW